MQIFEIGFRKFRKYSLSGLLNIHIKKENINEENIISIEECSDKSTQYVQYVDDVNDVNYRQSYIHYNFRIYVKDSNSQQKTFTVEEVREKLYKIRQDDLCPIVDDNNKSHICPGDCRKCLLAEFEKAVENDFS